MVVKLDDYHNYIRSLILYIYAILPEAKLEHLA